MFKNISGQKLLVFAFNRDTAEPVLGDESNITCKVALNNGVATALEDTNPTETEDGRYLFSLSRAETNGDTIDFYPESATAGVQVIAINHDRQSVDGSGGIVPAKSGVRGGYFASMYFGGAISGITDWDGADRIYYSGGMQDFSGIAQAEVFTLHDLVHRLTLRTGSNPTERTLTLLARAIQDAIRGLPAKHDWAYFNRQSRLTTSPSVPLSITYEHTGGVAERLITVTSGTLPDDAAMGEIVIGDKRYRVGMRISDTLATLERDFSLNSDFTGDATWARQSYQFSREMVKIQHVRISNNFNLTYLAPTDFAAISRVGWTSGTPVYFTCSNRGTRFGASEFAFYPYPDCSLEVEVSGTVTPLIPTIQLVSGGQAVASAGSNTITSSSATWDKRLVGSVFRVGRDSSPPINLDSSEWEFQAFITSVVNNTTIKLSEALPETISDRGYSISSPIDLESSVMLEYVEDEAYHQYTKNHDHQSFPVARRVAGESVRMAIARDNKASLNSNVWGSDGAWAYVRGGFFSMSPCPS